MGIWSSVSNAISSAVSSISSAVTCIGSSIGKSLGVLAPILGKELAVVNQVVKVSQVVLAVIDILKPNEKVEEIGDRAMQAADEGITPDQFNRYDKYMDAIRNFELDPKKSETYAPEDPILAGLSVCSHVLDEKLKLADGTSSQLWLLAAANPTYFDAQRLEKLISSENPVDFINYFTGKLGPAAELKVEDRLLRIEKELSPDKTDDAIFQDLDAVQHALRQA